MERIIQEDISRMLAERQDLAALENKTILISGANSFLMSYLIYFLLENNRRNHSNTTVVALCRSAEKARARFGYYWGDPYLRVLIQDVREPVDWSGAVDFCIHAASPAGIQSRQEKPLDTFAVNLFGCQRLLELAQKRKSEKFLLLSSVDVYGACQEQARRKEADIGLLDWTYQRSAYSCGKRGAETLCGLYYAQCGLPCVSTRPFQVYGPGMSLTDGRLHGDFICQLQEANQITLKSNGLAVRSFLYLADATLALLDVLLLGTPGGIYNICDESGECSVRELADLYALQWGNGAKVVFRYDQRETPEVKEALSVVTGDSSRLRALGWKNMTSLEEGVARTLAFYSRTPEKR